MNKLSGESVADMYTRHKSGHGNSFYGEMYQKAEQLENKSKKLTEALKNLLDVFERSEAGFQEHAEVRFLARDLAKDALSHE